MKLLVYLKDGRTVIRIEGRGILAQLVRAEPWHEKPGVSATKGTWNPHTGEYNWHRQVYVRYIASSSISHVEEDRGQDVEP